MNIFFYRKSNIALQPAFLKHGLDKFNFCVYEYFIYANKASCFKLITDLEKMSINKFKFSYLDNKKK